MKQQIFYIQLPHSVKNFDFNVADYISGITVTSRHGVGSNICFFFRTAVKKKCNYSAFFDYTFYLPRKKYWATGLPDSCFSSGKGSALLSLQYIFKKILL